MRCSLDEQEYMFLLEVLDMYFTFISLSISYVSLSITLQVEPECQQHLEVELSSSKSMEGIISSTGLEGEGEIVIFVYSLPWVYWYPLLSF